MRFRLLLYFVLNCPVLFSQAGYLGSLRGFEFKSDLNPSFKDVNKIRGNAMINGPKYFCPRYTFNYSQVITRHAEFAVGYELISGRVDLRDYTYINGYGLIHYNEYGLIPADLQPNGSFILNDPKFNHHAINLEYHYYRKGNLAPIGNYMGFAYKFGVCSIKDGQELIIGDIGNKIGQRFFRHKNEILDQEMSEPVNGGTIFTNHLNVNFGQNIPIGRTLILSFQVSLPLVYAATYNGKTRFAEWYPNRFYEDYYTQELIGFTAYTIGDFYKISIDIGVKWML